MDVGYIDKEGLTTRCLDGHVDSEAFAVARARTHEVLEGEHHVVSVVGCGMVDVLEGRHDGPGEDAGLRRRRFGGNLGALRV